jgi:hypothetical protein
MARRSLAGARESQMSVRTGPRRATVPAPPQPQPIPDGQAIPRIVSDGLESALERFSDRTLLAAGKVNLISLEAVERRLGAKWRLRQEQVYAFAARVIERGVGARGLQLRVSDTDFLIVQPDLGRLAAQAACLRCLREILNHFLGDAHLAGEGVLQVTRIAHGLVEAKPADPRAAELADEPPAAPRPAPDTAAASVAAAAPAPDVRRMVDRWSPFVAGDGRTLRVSASLEPVYELRGFTRIGFRMNRRVLVHRTEEVLGPAAVAALPAADLLKVDLATVARGVGRVISDRAGEQQLSLVVPLSYASLSSVRGRSELVEPLRAAERLVRCGVICEMLDIEGVPPGALLAAVSLVRPFALLVVGRLETATPSLVGPLKGAGLRGVSVECPPNLDELEFAAWAERTVRAAKRVARSVMVYRVESARRAGELAQMGATHVSLARPDAILDRRA